MNLLLFLALLFISYNGFTSMIEARNSAIHANEVIRESRRLEIQMLRLRADKRDFVLSGEDRFLERLESDAAAVEAQIRSIGEGTTGTQNSQGTIALLQDQYHQWQNAELDPLFRGISEGLDRQELRRTSISEPGRQAFEAFRETLAQVRAEQKNAVDRNTEEMLQLQSFTTSTLIWGGVAAFILGMFLLVMASWTITKPLTRITAYARRIAKGEYSFPLDIDQGDEVGVLARELRSFQQSMIEKTRVTEAIAQGDLSPNLALAGEKDSLGLSINRMIAALREAREKSELTDWVKSGLNELAARATGETDSHRLADKVLSFLTPYLNAQVATLYLLDQDQEGVLTRYGGYAVNPNTIQDSIALGQGLVGQAAREQRLISVHPVPQEYLSINSSLGESIPRAILALPITHQNDLIGVLEFGSFEPFPDYMVEFLEVAGESLGVAFDSLGKQNRVRELLSRTQKQAQQLKEQQEELRAANEELEEHTQILQQSEEELKQQREELQAINEELEEKNETLEKQKSLIQEKNRDLEAAWEDVRRKAAELEVSSRYKSEFLANMSHELRTPLNSLLLLARSLRDNTSGNLSSEDIEAAGIIHKNGTDLLNLINDILDLSKIEAGKMSVHQHDVHLAEVAGSMMMDFRLLAEEKGLFLKVLLDDDLPSTIRTDRQRLEQILRNILSNAVKFTKRGGITMHFHRPGSLADPRLGRFDPETTVALEIVDTGIGIPSEKQQEIFEAFQQVDGSTSRRFGGTGLGLTISRQLAHLLGGEITIESEAGKGSTFTVYLPVQGRAEEEIEPETVSVEPVPEPLGPPPAEPVEEHPQAPQETAPSPGIPDDREFVGDKDKIILIIEDDLHFAKILLNLCRAKGFKAVASSTGEEGLVLADRFQPTGILLDIRLPGISGWTVLNSLKRNHRTRHIPVHVISVHDSPHDALVMGAVGFLSKPVSGEDLEQALERIETVAEKKVKELLLVEDNADLRLGIQKLLSDLEVDVTAAETGGQALEAIRTRSFDCMILDLGLGDMSGFDLLKLLEKEQAVAVPPVIVYTGRELSKEEERELRKYAETIIIKGARSEERLLDEATLFLHRMVSTLPKARQRMIINLHNRDAVLEGRKVLLVDDDMRNLFALSRVLTEKGLRVVKAEDGAAALEVLDKDPEVDIVFMDIMMPGMDGYEAMQRIREQPRFAKLPVIALTAKAMKEDREKCIEAGANDYLAKPVDIDKMLSMMRVWLYRR
ncbi:MAG: response regulator [Desulfovibrionales bacterium]